jgi:hypothetical protein
MVMKQLISPINYRDKTVKSTCGKICAEHIKPQGDDG